MHCIQDIDYRSLRLTTRLMRFNFLEVFRKTLSKHARRSFLFVNFIIIIFFVVWGGQKKVRGGSPHRLPTRGNNVFISIKDK